MKHFHIGLDFGTYQSKACILHVADDQHEFFRFPPSNSFFLPSIVNKLQDGRFQYGIENSSTGVESYHYFKIAAAEDEEFHAETIGNGIGDYGFYSLNEFHNYSPEFLSTVYLTYLLYSVKEHLQQSNEFKKSGGGLLGRLLRRQSTQVEEIRFTVQLGIPTEWSQEKNIRRKRKFENILMLAELLRSSYKVKENFLQASCTELVDQVKSLAEKLEFPNKEAFDRKLNDLGLSVYPETAAGLTFIIQTKQLQPDYYAAMDIGGGSTDVSFFRVMEGMKIRYLASESYMMAANNVFDALSDNGHSIEGLRKAQDQVMEAIENDTWKENERLDSALHKVDDDLEKNIYRLFAKRVYWFDKGMIKKYTDQPIVIYGGGARLPVLRTGRINIHDHGNRHSINITLTYLTKSEIEEYTSIVNILPDDNSWQDDFSMLVVALGLSYIKPDAASDWFEDFYYNKSDGDKRQLVAHPFNEDCYIYDVIASKWK